MMIHADRVRVVRDEPWPPIEGDVIRRMDLGIELWVDRDGKREHIFIPMPRIAEIIDLGEDQDEAN